MSALATAKLAQTNPQTQRANICSKPDAELNSLKIPSSHPHFICGRMGGSQQLCDFPYTTQPGGLPSVRLHRRLFGIFLFPGAHLSVSSSPTSSL